MAAARSAMLAHPQVQGLIAAAATWPGGPIKRHNDASHALHKLTVLADMGVRENDPGMPEVVQAALAHVSNEGALLSVLNIAPAFGATGQDTWTWMMCDAPALLYALLLFHEGADGTLPLGRGFPIPEAPWGGDMLLGATSAMLPLLSPTPPTTCPAWPLIMAGIAPAARRSVDSGGPGSVPTPAQSPTCWR